MRRFIAFLKECSTIIGSILALPYHVACIARALQKNSAADDDPESTAMFMETLKQYASKDDRQRHFDSLHDIQEKLGAIEKVLYLKHFHSGAIGLEQLVRKYPGFFENPLALYNHPWNNGYLCADSKGDKVVIFIHMNKAGGSTLTNVMRRNVRHIAFRCDFHQQVNIHPIRILNMFRKLTPEVQEQEREQWNKYDVFANHNCYGVHELLSRPYAYITMLRDPIDRLLSVYRYTQNLPETSWTDKEKDTGRVNDIPFLTYLQDPFFQRKNNAILATNLIAGTPRGPLSEKTFSIAKKHLDTFEAVMIMERFDESMQLLQALYGWKDEILVEGEPRPRGDQVTGMVTKSANARSQLSPEEVAAAEEYLHYDVKLYEYGKALFEKQLQKHGVTERIAAKKAELVKDSLVA